MVVTITKEGRRYNVRCSRCGLLMAGFESKSDANALKRSHVRHPKGYF